MAEIVRAAKQAETANWPAIVGQVIAAVAVVVGAIVGGMYAVDAARAGRETTAPAPTPATPTDAAGASQPVDAGVSEAD